VLILHTKITFVEYVTKYASKEAADEAGEDNEFDEEMSSAGSYRSDGEEEHAAGEMEELWANDFSYFSVFDGSGGTYRIPLA